MSRLNYIFLVCIALIFSLVALTSARAQPALRMAITDLGNHNQIQKEFGAFSQILAHWSGQGVEFLPVRSRTAAVTALQQGQVDLVLTGPAEYVVFRKLTKAQPLVAFSRPDYFAGIMVLAARGPSSVAGLKGCTVLFGDVGSTSNHLAPMQLLADHGLDPLRDIKSLHISRHDRGAAWQALKQGKVAAIGMNHAKLVDMRDHDPDLKPGAFRFIARGPDLPNDVLLVGRQMPSQKVKHLRQVFVDHEAELIQAILRGQDNQKYQGMKIITPVKDSDYDYVRSMYRTIGFPRFSEFIKE